MNAPSFYTSMIRQFQDEWTLLFLLACNQQRVNYCNTTTGQPSGVCSTMPLTDDFKEYCCGDALPNLLRDDDYILNEASSPLTTDTTHTVPFTGGDVVVRQQMAKSKHFHVTGTRTIIDNIVYWSTSKSLALLMLECMCRVSLKYRASFKLSKCDFFFKRFEYVGHDIMLNGNTTAKSKYNLINNWALPLDVDNLHSFVCLCNYCIKFCPLFQLCVIPLRQLHIKYARRKIPTSAWTKELKELFHQLKTSLTSSPVPARYDSLLPIFLKTDWSALGIGFIIMKPNNDDVSTVSLSFLKSTGENNFDKVIDGPRLQPILFGSRKCTESESHYHSFVGEVATGRWAISENRVYFWGRHFYWLCDMKTVYKALTYDGPIHVIRRWSQELLAYKFTCVHRPNSMMQDVDALSRYHDPLVAKHLATTHLYRCKDRIARQRAYNADVFSDLLINRRISVKPDNVKSVTNKRKSCVLNAACSAIDQNRSETDTTANKNNSVTSDIAELLPTFIADQLVSEEWDSMIKPHPYRLDVNCSFIDIPLLQNAVFDRAVPCKQPSRISCVNVSQLNHKSASTNLQMPVTHQTDTLDDFLSKFVHQWVSINSTTGSLAHNLHRQINQNLEVTLIESSMTACRLCAQTTNINSIYCCSLESFCQFIASPIICQDIHSKTEQHSSISISIFSRLQVQILGLDIHFDIVFTTIPSPSLLPFLQDAYHLLEVARRLRHLK